MLVLISKFKYFVRQFSKYSSVFVIVLLPANNNEKDLVKIDSLKKVIISKPSAQNYLELSTTYNFVNLDTAIKYLGISYKLNKDDDELRMKQYFQNSSIDFLKNDFITAKYYLRKAKNLAIKLKNTEYVNKLDAKLVATYINLDFRDSAIFLANQILQRKNIAYDIELDVLEYITVLLMNEENNINMAKRFAVRLEKLARINHKYKKQSSAYMSLATIHGIEGNQDSSIICLQKLIEFATKHGHFEFVASSYLKLSKMEIDRNNNSELALFYLSKAEEIAKQKKIYNVLSIAS